MKGTGGLMEGKRIKQIIFSALALAAMTMCPVLTPASENAGAGTGLPGKGTEAEPYLIQDEAGWDLFCDALDNKEEYKMFSDKYVRLTKNISVSRMASDSRDKAFCGNFDGGNNTVTVNFGTESAPLEQSECALFRYTGGNASIKNINTDGKIYTKGSNVSGLVGMVTENFYKENKESGPEGNEGGADNEEGQNSLDLDNCYVGVEIHTMGNVGGCLVGAILPVNTKDRYGVCVEITGCSTDSHVYTDGTSFGGITGETGGSVYITGCSCSAIIDASFEGGGSHGGLIGNPKSTIRDDGVNTTYIEIDGCVFDGSFLGEKTSSWSGIMGDGHNNIPFYIRNTVFDPRETVVKDKNNRSLNYIEKNIGSLYYYTKPFGLVQEGLPVTETPQAGHFYRGIDAPNGKRYYVQCPEETIKDDFSYAEIQDPAKNMDAGFKDETGKELIAGEDYFVSAKKESEIDVEGPETYVLTFKGNEKKGYYGSYTKEVFVYDRLAHLPVITSQPGIMALMYGYEGEHKFSIEAHAVEGHSLAYQWYKNTVPKTFGGVKIEGATTPELIIGPGLDLQTTYYYCELTSTRADNGTKSKINSDVAMLTVRPREVCVTALEQTIYQNSDIVRSLDKAVLTGALEGHELKDVKFITTDTDKVTDRGAIIPADAVIMYQGKDVTDHYDIHYIQGVLKVEPLSNKPVDPDSGKGTGEDENYFHKTLNTGVEDEKGNFIILDVYYKKSISYNGFKHADKNYSKADKRTKTDYTVSVNSPMEGYAAPVLKFKNNKTAVIKKGKTPRFTMSFKAIKGASKNSKGTVKSVNAYLKEQLFEFMIDKADLEKARVVEFVTKNGKIKKFTVEINGDTMKLSKKDYDARPNADGTFSITGKNNFCGVVTLK